jgi:diguanylate cyclase (GGDEF)-like protein/PAS domain S-box-containing protein
MEEVTAAERVTSANTAKTCTQGTDNRPLSEPLATILSQPAPAGKPARTDELFSNDAVRLKGLLDGYQAALDGNAIVAVTDLRARILFVNAQFSRVSGYDEAELLGQSHAIVNSGHHPREFFIEMWRTIARGARWQGEICNRTKLGEIYWVDTTIVPLTGPEGRLEAYMSIRYDITRLKVAEAALREEIEKRRKAEALLTDVIETVPTGIVAFDAEDRLVMFNQAYAACFPHTPEAVRLGRSFEALLRDTVVAGDYVLSRNTPAAREAWIQNRLREHQNPSLMRVQEMADGRWMQIQERRSGSGHVVATCTDITELKRSEEAVKYLAEHDSLTGLRNRSTLPRHLAEAVATSLQTGRAGALLVVDLDGFKRVNDTYGHAAGDAMLVEISRRLTRSVRGTHNVVRLGGDEFAIIIPNVADGSEVAKIAAKLSAVVEQPLEVAKRIIHPKSSIGGALFPRDGQKLKVLLKKADLALYRAKAQKAEGWQLFSRSMQADIEKQRRMATALSAAVASDRIEIALQPQFTLDDCGHVGFEALARWTHRGVSVPPSRFIPVAEQSGLISTIGLQVMDKSLRAMRELQQSGARVGTLAINVAADQIRSPEFPSILESMVRSHRMAPSDVELELTENILLDDRSVQIALSLTTLKAMGFSIALDDFGTGYASLSHLSRFPVDRIKIDREFVADIRGPETCTIVRATIGLAHALGMKVVAEGIETQGQLAQLRRCDCDYGQGYLISRPLQENQLKGYMENKSLPQERLS